MIELLPRVDKKRHMSGSDKNNTGDSKVITRHSILFRCDGSHEIGFGHVVRCLALADELRERHGCDITFAMLRDRTAVDLIKRYGYKVATTDSASKDFAYEDWLNGVVHATKAEVLVLDVRDELPGEAIMVIRKKGVVVATIDDPTPRRLLADLAFYPPVPQLERLDWLGFTGRLYAGWEWVVLRKEFAHPVNAHGDTGEGLSTPQSRGIPNILVTMGGSDPQGMTIKAINALALLDDQFETMIILGPGFAHRKDLDELLDGFSHPYKIYENISNMSDIMAEADLAVASFGVTAYELAAMGVPAIYMCLTEDHVESASIFQTNEMAFCLGHFKEVTQGMLAQKIKYVLTQLLLREDMAKRSQKLVDGNGAFLIAQKIMAEINSGRKERVAGS